MLQSYDNPYLPEFKFIQKPEMNETPTKLERAFRQWTAIQALLSQQTELYLVKFGPRSIITRHLLLGLEGERDPVEYSTEALHFRVTNMPEEFKHVTVDVYLMSKSITVANVPRVNTHVDWSQLDESTRQEMTPILTECCLSIPAASLWVGIRYMSTSPELNDRVMASHYSQAKLSFREETLK